MLHGGSAWIRESTKGHLEVVRLLCLAGADKDKATWNGSTALMRASYSNNGHLKVAQLLCEAGADKDKATGMVARP